MKITPLKTHKITSKDKSIFEILDKYVDSMPEKSILAITSKIISLTEGNIIKIGTVDKDRLIQKEAEYFLPKSTNKYGFILTIKNNILVPTAGIDESNGQGFYILWPKNPSKSAAKIRLYLKKRFNLQKVGVIITDSKTTPLRYGTTGVGLSYSGFKPLNNYIGKKDLFGRKLNVTKSNILDGLAASAVVVMGEGSESTPLAVITDCPFVFFQTKNPSKKEREGLKIALSDDLYEPLLKSVAWRRGT